MDWNPIKVARQRRQQGAESRMKGFGDAEPPDPSPYELFCDDFATEWPSIVEQAVDDIVAFRPINRPELEGFRITILDSIAEEIQNPDIRHINVLHQIAEALLRGENMKPWRQVYAKWKKTVAASVIDSLYETVRDNLWDNGFE